MKIRHTVRVANSRRRGFTLIELLVVISIIATLAALILPGIQGARASARNLQCLNNIRNIGTGVMNFTSQNGGRLPRLAGDTTYVNDQNTEADTSDDVVVPYGWPVALLPLLDNAALDRLVRDELDDGQQSHQTLWATQIPVFTCPDDDTAFQIDGQLSYVANAGYAPFVDGSTAGQWGFDGDGAHDWNNINWLDGEPNADTTNAHRLSQSTGVFWRDVNGNRPIVTLDFISNNDGQTQTLMLSENLDAGAWRSAATGSIGFALQVPVSSGSPAPAAAGTNNRGLGIDDTPANAGRALSSVEDIGSLSGSYSIGDSQISAATPPGLRPWRPSSNHTGGNVNVFYCDGHAGSLNAQMDQSVYARLMTPAGTKYGQNVLKDTNF